MSASEADDRRWSLTTLHTTATNRPGPAASPGELNLHALLDEFIEAGDFDDLLDVGRAGEWPSLLAEFARRATAEAHTRWGYDEQAIGEWMHDLLWRRYQFAPGQGGAAFEAYVAFRRAVAVANERSGLREWGGEHDWIRYFPEYPSESPIHSIDLHIIVGTNSLAHFVLPGGRRSVALPSEQNELLFLDGELEAILTPELLLDTLALTTTFRDYRREWPRSRENHERHLGSLGLPELRSS